MKTHHLLAALAALVAAPLLNTHAQVVGGDPAPGLGVPYFWTVTLGANDSGIAINHVGAWSWEDDSLFDAGGGEPPVGWTHTSNWVALTLTSPALFTLRLERQEGVPWPGGGNPNRTASTDFMFPSFTLWSGLDNDGIDNDTYNNRGNMPWFEDISYMDHYDNSTLPAVERTWSLAAGNYTIVLGSNAVAETLNRQGYRATFTTAAVPEPGTTILLLSTLAGAFVVRQLRRRHAR